MLVYQATSPSGKVYVGITTSTLSNRKKSHKSKAFSGTSRSVFHAAILKYGFDSFIWEVIDTAVSIQELKQKEINWIEQHNCVAPNGYNLSLGGEGTFGYPAWNKGKKMPESMRKKMTDLSKKTPVLCLNTNTNVYTKYESISAAARNLGLNYGSLKISIKRNQPHFQYKFFKGEDVWPVI